MRVKASEYSDIVDKASIGCAWPVLEKNKRSFRGWHSGWNSQELLLADDVVHSNGCLHQLSMHFGARGVLVEQLLELCVRIMVMPEVAWRRDRSWRPCLS
jgi:hypothetical protein